MIKLIQLETCESTNDEAWKQLPETTLVVARHQTRGRGRQGRTWKDDEGNIMASLVFKPDQRLLPKLLWLPLAAGVAALDAITLSCGKIPEELRLKWPNDIMWGDAKMGGILCESRLAGENVAGLVVGLGLNLKKAPEVSEMRTTSLADHIPDLAKNARDLILNNWSDRVLFWIEALTQNQADDLRSTWLRYAKLERFPDFSVHDDKGERVKLKALDLDAGGRLKASLNSKIIYLDQPS